MKHVKTYEKHKFHTIKKYFILDIRNLEYEPGDFTILKKLVYQDVRKILMTSQIYIYDNNELIKTSEGNFAVFETDSNGIDSNGMIKYESDSLQDCLDNLPLIIKADKYNI